jgi:hypothetical protein
MDISTTAVNKLNARDGKEEKPLMKGAITIHR